MNTSPRSTDRARPDVDVAIIGSGPAGLATTLALRNADPKLELAILDPSGQWLNRWNERMARQRVEHLRSPITHHPHPEPWALLRFCRRENLLENVRDGQRLPTTESFARFVAEVVTDHGLDDRVEPASIDGLNIESDRIIVRSSSGTTLTCRHLVIAAGASGRRSPVEPHPDPRILHAEDVDLRHPPPAGTRVLVVGGGLSAAHLALGAVDAGLATSLAIRGAFRVRHFDVVPGWMGPRYLRGFQADPDPISRRRQVASARGGGSVPPWARRDLARLEQVGRLEILRQSPLLGFRPDTENLVALVGEHQRVVDAVWLATGLEHDVCASSVLAQLAEHAPIPRHGGIPDLGPNLTWGDTSVHVVGAPAALVLGPTAGNLHGQRRGAHRVAKAVVPSYEPVGEVGSHLH